MPAYPLHPTLPHPTFHNHALQLSLSPHRPSPTPSTHPPNTSLPAHLLAAPPSFTTTPTQAGHHTTYRPTSSTTSSPFIPTPTNLNSSSLLYSSPTPCILPFPFHFHVTFQSHTLHSDTYCIWSAGSRRANDTSDNEKNGGSLLISRSRNVDR